jgi:(p)ppGpp synthase/HD superfamily hydrolase
MGGTDDAARGSAPTLEDAIALAASAHRGQGYPTAALRREPFILHPLRVLLRLATDEERTVAALHDVLEDTPITLDELRRQGYRPAILVAVDRLTRRNGEPYAAYIERVAADPLARRVKLADLADNLAHNRDVDAPADERARVARYERARARLRRDDPV